MTKLDWEAENKRVLTSFRKKNRADVRSFDEPDSDLQIQMRAEGDKRRALWREIEKRVTDHEEMLARVPECFRLHTYYMYRIYGQWVDRQTFWNTPRKKKRRRSS